jgi:hypothetical protein
VAGAGRFTAVSTNAISTNTLTLSNINGTGDLPITAATGCNANITGLYINLIANNVQFSSNFAMNTGTTAATYNLTAANFTRTVSLSTNSISTNIVNAGYLVGLLPGNTAATSVSPLAVTNGAAYLTFSPQIEFQYFSGGFKHFMGSRHFGGVTNNNGNAIDFWLYSATGGSNASTTPGTCNVNTMSVTAAGVGINNNAPSVALDVTGGGRFTGISTTTISTNSILADNISSYSIVAENGAFSTFGSLFSYSETGFIQQAFMSSLLIDTILSIDGLEFITMGNVVTNSISTQQIYVSSISSGSVYGKFFGDGSSLTGIASGGSGGLPISTNNTTLTNPASIIIKTPNTSYFYEDYTNLTNYITISNYGAQNGDYINIVNTGNSGTPATFQVLDGSTGVSSIIRYIYPGHAGVVAYSSSQWWPL